MRYSNSGSEYFRNKKGGGLETNGTLNTANFGNKENKRGLNRRYTNPVELQEMKSSNNNNITIKPIKIMVKKKLGFKGFLGKSFLGKLFDDEQYIFFGLNQKTGIYEYVIYVNQDFSQLSTTGSPIICKRREKDGTIVELTHHQFLEIDVQELSILVYRLLLIRKKNKDFLDKEFFRYLSPFVIPIILDTEIHNKNYMYIVGEIKKILPKRNNNVNNDPALPPRRTKQ